MRNLLLLCSSSHPVLFYSDCIAFYCWSIFYDGSNESKEMTMCMNIESKSEEIT